MEITCARCHQAVLDETCYCPNCGLPQLVYSIEGMNEQGQAEHGAEPVRDASMVAWKTALRAAAIFALPAGLLSSLRSPLGGFALIWMAGAATWAVALYMRSQRPAWITIGAGARIGLVTGILGAWMAFATSGGTLFVERFVLHQAAQIDAEWKTGVDLDMQLLHGWIAGMGMTDTGEEARKRASMLSAEGHAGWQAWELLGRSSFLLLFSIAGGAIGARFLGRMRRPEV